MKNHKDNDYETPSRKLCKGNIEIHNETERMNRIVFIVLVE